MIKSSVDYERVIKDKCDMRLKEIFAAGIPADVSERYQRELGFMLMTDSQETLALYSALSEEAAQKNAPLLVRGTAGCSLLTYLLGNSLINPLEAYYYCTECGHYERITEQVYGIDAKEKECPKCGAKLIADGCSLEENFVWFMGEKSICFEYSTANDFVTAAGECIKDFYREQEVVQLAGEDWVDGKKTGTYSRIGFTVLPKGKTVEDYAECIRTLHDGSNALYIHYDDPKRQDLIRILIVGYSKADQLEDLMKKKGINISDFSIDDLGDIDWSGLWKTATVYESEWADFRQLQPKTAYDCVQAMCAMHSTYTEKAGLMFPSREALFRFLMKQLNENDGGKALSFEIADFVRRGKATNNRWKKKWTEYVEKADLTEDVIAACESTRYLWPEAHVIGYLLLDVMIDKCSGA